MGIDNLLGRPVDPTLLGMLRGLEGRETGVEVAVKAIKVDPKSADDQEKPRVGDDILHRIAIIEREEGEDKK